MKKYLLLFFWINIGYSESKYSPYIDFEVIEKALFMYKEDCGFFPAPKKGLTELINSNLKCWNGPYLKKSLLKDNYQNEYIYKIDKNKTSLILSSVGKDGVMGTYDDFSNKDDSKKRKFINEMVWGDSSQLLPFLQYFIFLIFVVLIAFLSFKKLKKR